MGCPPESEVSGRVTGYGSSPNGDFIYVQVRHYGTVTVALSATPWQSGDKPEHNEIIILSGLKKFSKGWRATSARRYTLEDEKCR